MPIQKVSCDLVIDHGGMVLETSIRIFDQKSLDAALVLVHSRAFGHLSIRKIQARTPEGDYIPLCRSRGAGYVRLSEAFVQWLTANFQDIDLDSRVRAIISVYRT